MNKSSAASPAPEAAIEVTPEMLEAGSRVLLGLNREIQPYGDATQDSFDPHGLAEGVYRAMVSACSKERR